MVQAERIQKIFQLLQARPCTIEEILEQLHLMGVKVQKRQLYFDLNQLENYYLRSDEALIVLKGPYNRKTYALKTERITTELSTFDINSYQLAVSTHSLLFNQKRGASLQKFKKVMDEALLKEGKLAYTFLDREKLLGTHFYESNYSNEFNETMEDIIWAVSNNKVIEILSLKGDPTSLYKVVHCPFIFKPISILYHRGEFFLSGFEKAHHVFTTLDISKIENYRLTNQTFSFRKLQQLSKQLLAQRFGITNNMDDHIYDIQLEFSSITGEFVSRFNWHHTQRFEQLQNGNWKCHLTCGINRELVGWIFQWMGNVKVVSPDILTNLYLQQLEKINDIYDKNNELQYSNIFQP